MLLILKKESLIFGKSLKTRTQAVKEPIRKLVASKHGTPNGSAKAHKPFKSGLPPFRSIVSAIVTHTYKLEKI